MPETPTPKKFATLWSQAFEGVLAPHVRDARVDIGVAGKLGAFEESFRLVMSEHLRSKSARFQDVCDAAFERALASARASTLQQAHGHPLVEPAYLPADLRRSYDVLLRRRAAPFEANLVERQ